ncbi:MAG: aminotransferase class III-fold pyridoxal phosphate-dependent enzyme [Actinobacteria bacterium]|nr:aminotransferase class III-fold pyridoxal phosphate-dependent enzyme [Actinomycetota bacterium]
MSTLTTDVEQKRKVVTAIPGPKSEQIIARRSAAVSASLGMAMPAVIERAAGGILVDVDGNHIIDLGAGIAVVNVGNSAPHVVENVQRQVELFTHTCFMVAPYLGYIEVCEALNRLTPGKFAKKSVLLNSGAEALENAVKIARSCAAACEKNALDVVIHKLDKEVGGKNIAAIVIEPIQGEGGFIVPPKGFLPGLAKYAKDNGALFIADEVQTGFARTGQMFASEDENLEPDLITTAKGIAGGLPLAAVTGRAEVMDSIHASGLGGTYGGSPVACAAALGAIQTIEEEKLVDRAKKIGTIMSDELNKMKAKHAIIGEVRGRGAMQAIELVIPGGTEPNTAALGKIVNYCQEKGVLILTAGTYSNVIRLIPPLVIPEDLLREGLSILDEALATI